MPQSQQLDESALHEIRTVVEDLEHIVSDWSLETTEANLRRESPMLRRLLIEGSFARCWRSVGLPKQPLIRASDLEAYVGRLERRHIAHAWAPLATLLDSGEQRINFRVPGSTKAGDLMITTPGYEAGLGPVLCIVPAAEVNTASKSPQEMSHDVASQFGTRTFRSYWLAEYLKSPGAILAAEDISRQDIIKYVANRHGGAHHDSRRDRLHPSAERKYQLLDSQSADLNTMPALYLELLSIGQFLAESTDAFRFLNVANGLLNERGASGDAQR